MTTLNLQVSDSSDDAHYRHGVGGEEYYSHTDTTVRAGNDDPNGQYISGMRFLAVTIPQGATIVSAYLKLTSAGGNFPTSALTKVSGEAVDNAATFSAASNPEDRAKTSAQVDWDISVWTNDAEYSSPDIKAVIQEIVDRAGWPDGWELAIFWDDDGTAGEAVAYAHSYDGDAAKAPKLTIEYTVPTAGGYAAIF